MAISYRYERSTMNNLEKIRHLMDKKGFESIFFMTNENRVTKNIYYLSGFSGTDGFLIVTMDKAILLVDGRYPEQAREEATDGVDVELTSRPLVTGLGDTIKKLGVSNVGLEESVLSHSFYKKLTSELEDIKPMISDGITEELRLVKTNEEIEKIRMACQCSDSAFSATLEYIKQGVVERDISTELEYQMKRRGASKVSFDIIVASGYRGAMAHGIASDKKLEAGDFVVIDFGATINHYNSDCTRTLMIGEPTDKHKKIYDAVREAQEVAMGHYKPGKKYKDPDLIARGIITKAGYGVNFNHSLGHGIGLDVHESPTISQLASEDLLLVENMVASNEPGIYLEGWGGVRIEDTVTVKDHGGEPLTRLSKNLIVIE
jgi:Xaa-Pro aminopeptidase